MIVDVGGSESHAPVDDVVGNIGDGAVARGRALTIVVCVGLVVLATPAVVVVVVVEVDGEPSGPNDTARGRSGGEADANVVAEASVVGERHCSGAETEVGVSSVVHKYAIASP